MEVSTTYYYIKISLLTFLSFLSLVLIGIAFKLLALNTAEVINMQKAALSTSIWVIFSIGFSAIIFSLVALLVKPIKLILGISAVSWIGYIVGFSFGPVLKNQIIISAISASLLLLAVLRLILYIRAEYLNSIKLRIRTILPKTMHGYFTLLGLILSLNFYIFFNIHVKKEGFSIPENLLEKSIEPALTIIEKNLGDQITRQFGDKFEQSIGTSNQQQVLEFLKGELGESFSEGTTRQKFGLNKEKLNLDEIGIKPNGDLDLKPFLRDLKPTILNQLNKAIEPYIKYIPIIATLIIFLTLQSIFIVIPYLVIPMISLIIFLMKKVKFAKLETQTTEIERLNL